MANKIHTEIVKGNGKKARWPYDTTLPNAELYNTVMENVKAQKQGSTFIGWKYNGTIYREPFDNESSNPFGPITQNANIFAVWDRIEVFCQSNHGIIQGTGDEENDLTRITYWAQSATGTIISDNVTLENVSLEPDETIITFEDRGTSVVNNKNVKTIKVDENTSPTNQRFLKIRACYNGIYSDVLIIKQGANGQVVLPPFDYMTFTYHWEETDGKDLDSATLIRDSNIPINSSFTLNDYYVGYGGSGNFESVAQFLMYGGDNMYSGDEGAFINWKKVLTTMTDSGLIEGVNELHLDIYANWFKTKTNGKMHIVFNTFKSPNDTGMTKNGYVFEPNPGTTPVSSGITSKTINVYAHGFNNANQSTVKMKQYYTKVAEVVYNIYTKEAELLDNISQQGGRDVKDININFNSNSFAIIKSTLNSLYSDHMNGNQHSGSFSLSNFSANVDGSIITNYTINPSKLKLKYYGYSLEDNYVSATITFINGVYRVDWTCNSNNTGQATERNCDICVYVETEIGEYELVYNIYQSSL